MPACEFKKELSQFNLIQFPSEGIQLSKLELERKLKFPQELEFY